jgi:pyruvate/oxaloacetate carboxyltransferase
LEQKKLTFVDQTLRDGQQSLWAFTMRTDHITPIADLMDQVGFKAVGTIGGHGITVQVRALNEDPWERMRLLSTLMPKTPLETSFSIMNLASFDIDTPRDLIALWIKQCVAHGIRSFWNCDYQNDMETVRYFLEIVKNEGAENVAGLMYTFSPFHDKEHWARKTRMIAEMKDIVDSIRIEDASGILTPERTRELLATVLENCDGIPIEFHSHCNTGLAPLCYLEAIRAGVTILHTAVEPLANGTSLPAVQSVLRNAKRMGYTSNLDEDALAKVSAHFRTIAEQEGLPIGVPKEYDLYYTEHQVPGGMMTNLARQLKEVGKEDLLPRVLEEIIQVRKELGYPVMATPYSQLVGAQAVENIVSGERYQHVTDEVIKYILGFYGEPTGPIEQNVKDKIMATPQAKRLANWRPQGRFKSLEEIRKERGPDLSDDELLLKIMVPGRPLPADQTKKSKRPAGKPVPSLSVPQEFPKEFAVEVNGDVFHVKISPVPDGSGGETILEPESGPANEKMEAPAGAIFAGMAGLLLSFEVKVGDTVKAGDPVAVIEAMKMRRYLNCTHDGVVKDICVHVGQIVEPEDIIIVVQ